MSTLSVAPQPFDISAARRKTRPGWRVPVPASSTPSEPPLTPVTPSFEAGQQLVETGVRLNLTPGLVARIHTDYLMGSLPLEAALARLEIEANLSPAHAANVPVHSPPEEMVADSFARARLQVPACLEESVRAEFIDSFRRTVWSARHLRGSDDFPVWLATADRTASAFEDEARGLVRCIGVIPGVIPGVVPASEDRLRKAEEIAARAAGIRHALAVHAT